MYFVDDQIIRNSAISDYLSTSSTFLGTSSPSSTVTASGAVGPVFLAGHGHVGHGTLGAQQYFCLERRVRFMANQNSDYEEALTEMYYSVVQINVIKGCVI